MGVLDGKTIVFGVTGGVAAYKSCEAVSRLKKLGATVCVIMTKNATEFVAPMTFETLSNQPCVVDTFARPERWEVEHVSLAKRADLFVIAPATANIMAKLAHGIADDMLSTTCLATRAPMLIAPAMNTGMWENVATQENLKILQARGMHFVGPEGGYLACGDVGAGRMSEPAQIVERCVQLLTAKRDMQGLRVLVTAGPTCENIDPVRFITNRSSGKMGYALAEAALRRGAQVTLISGPVSLAPVPGVAMRPVTTAKDMLEAVRETLPETDILIKAAAVADYRPVTVADQKIKKKDSDMSIPLERTDDILGWVEKNRHPGLFVCGFSMETENMVGNSRAKLEKKHLDMIAANNLKTEGAGFGVATNVVTLITKDGINELPLMGKDEVAGCLLDEIAARR